MRRAMIACVAVLAACSGDEEPPKSTDMGGSIDQFILAPDQPPSPVWVGVRVDDKTPVGQGLPLDAAEICNPLGMGCEALAVDSSSDDQLSYSGVDDGPNSQADSCTEDTFVRLAGDGANVVFVKSDASEFVSGNQVNIWTGDSACPLIEAGDKAFTVTFIDANGGESDPESCAGTCSVSVPQ